LADVHGLSFEQRQSHLIRAKATPLDLETVLKICIHSLVARALTGGKIGIDSPENYFSFHFQHVLYTINAPV
jgi:hypothetical protein